MLSAPITGAGSQPRENTRRKGAQLPPVEGPVSLQTTSQRHLDPSPTRKEFPKVLPRTKTPHLGLQKCGVVFDNYILLIRQFYRLPVFSFSTSRSCTHTVNQLKLSLDKKAAETERTESESELERTSESLHGSTPPLLDQETAWGGERMCPWCGEQGTGS